MATQTLHVELESGTEMVIGHVCQFPSGEYWFNPRLSNRRPSRKGYETPEKCIPRWAKKMATRVEIH